MIDTVKKKNVHISDSLSNIIVTATSVPNLLLKACSTECTMYGVIIKGFKLIDS